MSMRSTGAALAERRAFAEWAPSPDGVRDDVVRVARTRVLENGLGLVESLRVAGPPAPSPRSESFSADFQVCLPFHGAFVWHVGHDDVVADPNRVLFVAGGEGFRLSQPIPGGYGELMVGGWDMLHEQDEEVDGTGTYIPHETPGRTLFVRAILEF